MQERNKRVVEAWMTGKYSLDQIASMNDIVTNTVSRIITGYLNSLKKKK